jgi:tetratricopeptide (TPR) repeat protein
VVSLWDNPIIGSVCQVVGARLADAAIARGSALVALLRRRFADRHMSEVLDAVAGEPSPSRREHFVAALATLLTEDRALLAEAAQLAHAEDPVTFVTGLPPSRNRFVNRKAELALFRTLTRATLVDGASGHGAALVLLTGPRGIGKTRTAIELLREQGRAFDAGPFYVDLAEPRHTNATPLGDIAALLLEHLDVAPSSIAGDLGRRMAQYRDVTKRRSMLLVLDNVVDATEVTGLLPTSPRSLVIATSIRPPEALLAQGAERIALDRLDADAAIELIAGVTGQSVVDAEPEAAKKLAALCCNVPLALGLAGERAKLRLSRVGHGGLADYAAGLRQAGPTSVIEAIGVAIHETLTALPLAAATLCALLARHPGPDFTTESAKALAGGLLADVPSALDDLFTARLVEPTRVSRYRLIGLARDYLCAARQDSIIADTLDHEAAFRRVLTYYRDHAVHADYARMGARLRVYEHELDLTTHPFTAAEALNWLDEERFVLAALTREAAERGMHREVIQLCGAMEPLFLNRSYLGLWLDLNTLGVQAAAAFGDMRAEARLRAQQARVLIRRDELAAAEPQVTRAVDVAERGGDPAIIASVYEVLAQWHEARGDRAARHGERDTARSAYRKAIAAYEHAAAVDRTAPADDPAKSATRGYALHRRMLANCLVKLVMLDAEPNRPLDDESRRLLDTASAALDQAVENTDADDVRNRSRIYTVRGKVAHARARHADAVAALTTALGLAESAGTGVYEAEIREVLGAAAAAAGDAETARLNWEIVAGLWREAGLLDRLDAITARLAQLPPA